MCHETLREVSHAMVLLLWIPTGSLSEGRIQYGETKMEGGRCSLFTMSRKGIQKRE